MSRISDLFQYGQDIRKDNQIDIDVALFQRNNPFFGSNNYIGISKYENYPNTQVSKDLLIYRIVNWFAYRNNRIAPFEQTQRERRMITSQSIIEVEQINNILKFIINYLNYLDLQESQINREVLL